MVNLRANKGLTYAQTLLYLIRRSYGYIYHLMLASEPVSEALLPIYNQLQTLKRCLLEVKSQGGVSEVRDLYPYSMKVRVHISKISTIPPNSMTTLLNIA